MEIKEIKINEINIPNTQVYEPLIPRIKKVPKIIIDYPACIKVHRNNLVTQIDIDENGTVIKCGVEMPSYEPLNYTPNDFIYTQSELSNKAKPEPVIQPDLTKLVKKEKEDLYVPCPPLNPPFRTGDYRNDLKIERLVKWEKIENDCVAIWEEVPFRESFIGTPQMLISTTVLGVVAGGSALLAPVIKKLLSTIFKQLKKKILKEEKEDVK
tara:strand:- start:1125 stop:1757 length:633 start_codon:yes stop_codon:yes gene_type:complete